MVQVCTPGHDLASRAATRQWAHGPMYAPRRLTDARFRMVSRARRIAVLFALSGCWAASHCRAQEIEPRSYSPAPTGVNFLVTVVGHSEGGVLTDPSLPL